MRSVIAALAVATVMCVSVAHAEKRMFIIANLADDGYGVDRCLTTGAECGKVVANSYCRSHDFAAALSFRNVDRGDITSAIPTNASSSCKGNSCDNLIAIECSR
jgi:hypothetical protein